MIDLIYKFIGRSSLVFDCIRPLLSPGGIKKCSHTGDLSLDKTGLVVRKANPMEILWNDSEILFVKYDSLAHSFWRAQESSLFMRHKNLIVPPILDFGCGDGSFASSLFREIDYGVDSNPEALSIAEKYRIYKILLQSTNISIPVEEAVVRSVISNSVLEHLFDLDTILSEINRILMKDGIFIFTVPVINFKYYVKKYFGNTASDQINIEYHHRNLLGIEQWKEKLETHGFSIIKLIHYQPDWFTFWYRMFRLFGERGLGYFLPGIGIQISKQFKPLIVNMVRKSINETVQGANIFVVAKKDKIIKPYLDYA